MFEGCMWSKSRSLDPRMGHGDMVTILAGELKNRFNPEIMSQTLAASTLGVFVCVCAKGI